MSKKEDALLFDLEQYNNVDKVYQLRVAPINSSHLGEVIATFKDLHLITLMKDLSVPEGSELIITEYTKWKGITDIIGQIDGVLW